MGALTQTLTAFVCIWTVVAGTPILSNTVRQRLRRQASAIRRDQPVAALGAAQASLAAKSPAESPAAPFFKSFGNLGLNLPNFSPAIDSAIGKQPTKTSNLESFNQFNIPQVTPVDLQSLGNGAIPGLAPIPVPGFPGPIDSRPVPGVDTIPGLDMFNYLVGTLIPQAVPPANQLLGGSLSRLLPQDQTKNLARNIFQALAAPPTNVDVDRMMGRWFQVINSPHVIREACTVSHYGALTNNSYSATFTILKFYREGTTLGSPRFSLGYGFKAGDNGTFVVHNSNNPDAEPYWVIKVGPLNEYNQYDYAIISNWVKFPVLVQARDPERFQKKHMKDVLQFLEEHGYINLVTKALSMVSPVDYSQCQYTPTFSGAGK